MAKYICSNIIFQSIIQNARNLAINVTKEKWRYRDIIGDLNCIRLKGMRNEDFRVIDSELETGGSHVYAVNALDDIASFGANVRFPEEVRER